MTSKYVAVILLGSFGSGVLGGVYPAEYPYENEEYVPPNFPEATPSYTFVPDDVGGYVYTWGIKYLTGYEDYADTGYCLAATNMSNFVLVGYGLPPVLDVDQWNCTLKELWFEPSDYTGTVAGKSLEKICEVGQCCSKYYGLVKYADDILTKQQVLDNLAGGGLCEEMVLEDMYCDAIDGNWRMNCYERNTSPSDRLIVSPCIDVYMNYWLKCPVVVATGMDWGLDWEPDVYDDLLSMEQAITLEQSLSIDHVCYPYSYYYPDVKKGPQPDAEGGKGSGEAGTSGTDSSSTSGGKILTPLKLLSLFVTVYFSM